MLSTKKVVMNGSMYSAPFADRYRPLSKGERETLSDSIDERGILHAVTTYRSEVFGLALIDGVNRAEIGGIAGKEVPVNHLGLLSDDVAQRIADQLHLGRRNLDPAKAEQMRKDRIVRIAEKRAGGKSTRQIAEEEGVSQSQVVADIKSATEQGCSVEPKKVKGKDGKERPAKKQSKPKAANHSEASTSATEQGCSVELPAAPVDGWDIPIQPHAAEAFDAVAKFKELVSVLSQAQRLFNEVANLPGGKFLTLPDVSSYRRGKKGDDGEHADRFVHEGLETALRQVKNAVPTHTVCPWNYVEAPHPENCRTCHGLNWTPVLGSNVPKDAIDKAKEAHGV